MTQRPQKQESERQLGQCFPLLLFLESFLLNIATFCATTMSTDTSVLTHEHTGNAEGSKIKPAPGSVCLKAHSHLHTCRFGIKGAPSLHTVVLRGERLMGLKIKQPKQLAVHLLQSPAVHTARARRTRARPWPFPAGSRYVMRNVTLNKNPLHRVRQSPHTFPVRPCAPYGRCAVFRAFKISTFAIQLAEGHFPG